MIKNKKGFTLLELLVVILIVGVLAAIAIPQYQMAVRKTEFATLQPMVNAILDAENRYFLVNGTFTDILNLDIDLPGATYINKFGSILPNGTICSTNVDNEWLFCSTRDIKNAYLAISANSDRYVWGAGKKYCAACSSNTQDKYNKLCQKLTGRTEPDTQVNWKIIDYYCRGRLYQYP